MTADDALIDLLDVYDIFQDFEIPLTVFICTGWVDNTEHSHFSSMSRIVDFVRWYNKANKSYDLGKYGSIELNKQSLDRSIDWLIQMHGKEDNQFIETVWDAFRPDLDQSGKRMICNWNELTDLKNSGVLMGSHSVSHNNLAKSSDIRLEFELEEARRLISSKLSECRLFAYPFGTSDVMNQRTSRALKLAGYECGFSTEANFQLKNLKHAQWELPSQFSL